MAKMCSQPWRPRTHWTGAAALVRGDSGCNYGGLDWPAHARRLQQSQLLRLSTRWHSLLAASPAVHRTLCCSVSPASLRAGRGCTGMRCGACQGLCSALLPCLLLVFAATIATLATATGVPPKCAASPRKPRTVGAPELLLAGIDLHTGGQKGMRRGASAPTLAPCRPVARLRRTLSAHPYTSNAHITRSHQHMSIQTLTQGRPTAARPTNRSCCASGLLAACRRSAVSRDLLEPWKGSASDEAYGRGPQAWALRGIRCVAAKLLPAPFEATQRISQRATIFASPRQTIGSEKRQLFPFRLSKKRTRGGSSTRNSHRPALDCCASTRPYALPSVFMYCTFAVCRYLQLSMLLPPIIPVSCPLACPLTCPLTSFSNALRTYLLGRT